MSISRVGGRFWTAILEQLIERSIVVGGEMRIRRDIRRTLGSLSDDALQDIGLIRNDLEPACSDAAYHAAAELTAAARDRSGNW
jgi:uncharacterized protein YjiS (DUF1127 family)